MTQVVQYLLARVRFWVQILVQKKNKKTQANSTSKSESVRNKKRISELEKEKLSQTYV
jgi:hypothetical protein